MEREEGKLTSQERFWQARLMSKEAEYRTQLNAIHQQLEALKDTTNNAKADLETEETIAKHNNNEHQEPKPVQMQLAQKVIQCLLFGYFQNTLFYIPGIFISITIMFQNLLTVGQ